MTHHRIQAALFDFGGVLAEEGFCDGLEALAREQGLDPDQLGREGMAAVYDSGFVLGRGSAADFWALLRERTGLAGNDHALSERILAGFTLRPAMLALVERLRQAGYRTVILSDQTDWLDELERRQPFAHAFDRIYNSCRLGRGKRDPALFGEVAADLGLPPAALLFVDDDVGNVNRAREAGYQAMLFTDQDTGIAEIERLLD